MKEASNSSNFFFSGVEPPETFMNNLAFLRALSTISLVVFTACFMLFFARLRELKMLRCNGRRKASLEKKIKLWVLLNLATAVVTQVINIPALYGTFDNPETITTCQTYYKLTAFFYITGMWANYNVLSLRAEASIKMLSRRVRQLFSLIKLVSMYGVPCIALFSLVFISGDIVFDLFCVQSLSVPLAWVFLTSDTALSIGFLILFFYPALNHLSSETKENQHTVTPKMMSERKRIRGMIRKNIRLSLIQIVSTFIVHVNSCILSSRREVWNPNHASYLLVYYIGYIFDALINTYALLELMNKWTPSCCPSLGAKRGAVAPQHSTYHANASSVSQKIDPPAESSALSTLQSSSIIKS